MILGKVRIRNFKSIIDTGWVYLAKNDLVTVLAWQNESWKTSFLRWLKYFEEWEYSTFVEEDKRLNLRPKVECIFYLTSKEYEDLKIATNKKIADYFKEHWMHYFRWNLYKDDHELYYSSWAPEWKDLEKVIDDFNNSIETATEWEEEWNEAVPSSKPKFSPWKYFRKIRPDIIYYSSFTEDILPWKVMYNEIDTNNAVQDFETVYEVDFKEALRSTTSDSQRAITEEDIRKKASDSLNAYWNQKITWEEVQYKFNISLKPCPTDDSQAYVNFFVNQWDKPQLVISQKSQWFQWFLWFNLRLRAHEVNLEDDDGLILLIDEPGQWLHETAQQDLLNVINELSNNSWIQIIYSTHQPTLLWNENIDFERLLLVERNNSDWTMFNTIGQAVNKNGDSESLSPIRTALGLITLTNPFTQDKKSIVTEWICEYYYLKSYFGDKYNIIPARWASQVPNIFSILYWWWVPAKALFDDDIEWKRFHDEIVKEMFWWIESEVTDYVYCIPWTKWIEDVLSETVISKILKKEWKTYDKKKNKIKNIEQLWMKSIFAKMFYDYFHKSPKKIDKETIENFKSIEDFIWK